MLKKGAVRYTLMWDGGKIDYWTYVLRTIQTRKRFGSGITYGCWWAKLDGTTYGKLSKKQGDRGWLPKADPFFREKHRIEAPPYHASKAGALRAEIADLRKSIKDWGDDPDEDGVGNVARLKTALAAQKRMRKAK